MNRYSYQNSELMSLFSDSIVKLISQINLLISFSDFTYEPQAIPEWSYRKTSDGEVEVGYGI